MSDVGPKNRDPVTGLPIITEEAKAKTKNVPIFMLIKNLVMLGVGYGIAWLVWAFGDSATYQQRIQIAKDYDGQWFMLALVVLQFTVMWMVDYSMTSKLRVMNVFEGDKDLHGNQFIYKFATKKDNEGSAIIVNEEGDVGQYNRANKSLYQFLENCLGFVAMLPLSFFLFTIPTFVSLAAFCFGRVIYQIAYTSGGKQVLGWFLDRIATLTVTGLMILAYQKSF